MVRNLISNFQFEILEEGRYRELNEIIQLSE